MKKIIKLLTFAFGLFLLTKTQVFAREMTINELGKEALDQKKDNINYIYIIGKYAFTDKYKLTSQDIMLAARSIEMDSPISETDYSKMSIHTIRPVITDDKITGWRVDRNLFGDNKLTDDEVLNIRYIDYQFYPEKSKTDISLDVNDTEYESVLRENLKFETNKFYGKEGLKLDGNKVNGLLLKNKNVSLSNDDKLKYKDADYFFAYILEIPDATENTTIQVTNIYGDTKTIGTNKFDVKLNTEGKKPGIVLLAPISKALWESNNKIMTIVVDIDGNDKNEYGPTEYTLDLSGLTFQNDSIADLKLNNPSTNDKSILDSWGYNSNLNKELSLVDGVLTGTLVEQVLDSAIAFGGKNKLGYYFDFKFDLPDGIDLSKIKIARISDPEKKEIKKEFIEKEYDENKDLTILQRFDPDTTTCSSDCKLYFSVDYDGEEENYLEKIYSIDYKDVIFEKTSLFTVETLKKEDANNFSLDDSDAWYDEKNGYFVEVNQDKDHAHKYNITGVLPIFDDSNDDYSHHFETSKDLYYFGLLLKLDNAKNINTEGEEKISVKFLNNDIEDNQFLKVFNSDFDNKKEIFILKALEEISDKKVFDIEIDYDGGGKEYAPYTITIDWSGLKLQTKSTGNDNNFDIINSNEDLVDKPKEIEFLNGFDYNYEADSEVTTNTVDSKKEITGIIKEQTLNKSAGYNEPNGYYVPIKISFPNDKKFAEYKNKWTLILNTEDNKTKEYKPEDYEYEQGWVLVLFKVDRSSEDKMIKYQIDYDGPENFVFMPQEYTIGYNNLKFESENKITYNYKDKNGKNQNIEQIVYETEKVTLMDVTSENNTYRKFDKWTKATGEDASDITTTKENEDIVLDANWTLDEETFIDDVVKDLNSTDITYSNDFSEMFSLVQDAEDKNNISIKLKKPKVPLTELEQTSIPGTIAYILNKDEIKTIELNIGSQHLTFDKNFKTTHDIEYEDTNTRKILSDEAKNLKMEIIKEIKYAFNEELKNHESTATLDQLEYENKSFSIKIGNLDKNVKLVDSEKNEITNDDDKTYTFNFDSDFVVVKQNGELGATNITGALKNEYNNIYLDGNISSNEIIEINKNVNIEPVDNKISTISVTDKEYVLDIKSESTVNISNLTLSGATKAGVKVENKSNLNANKINIPDKIDSGFEVAGNLEGSNLTFENESYDNPTVKVLNKDKGSASVQLKNSFKIDYYIKVTKHDSKWCSKGEKFSRANNIECGSDEKSSWSDEYNPIYDRHYYLNKENAKEYYFVSFMDERVTTVLKLVEKGEKINMPSDFSTDYKSRGRTEKDTSTIYEFKGWKNTATGKNVTNWDDETAIKNNQMYQAIYEKKE